MMKQYNRLILLLFLIITGFCFNLNSRCLIQFTAADSSIFQTDTVIVNNQRYVLPKDSIKAILKLFDFCVLIDTSDYVIYLKEDAVYMKSEYRYLLKEPFSDIKIDQQMELTRENITKLFELLDKYLLVDKRLYYIMSKRELEEIDRKIKQEN